jgi:glycosyltransferase involved in cell wall biosynthesis
MRIAWMSNAPWTPTGYGQQTAEVTPLLKKDGHEVAILANYGLAGTISDWNGIPVYPHGLESYSNDLAPYQAQDWTHKNAAGWTISLYDSWTFNGPGYEDLNIAAWTPVDHKPMPPKVLEFFNRGKGHRLSIAMSRFGEQEMLEAGLARERVFYAPHSVNTQIFKPTPSTIRKDLGIPDDAHVTMINAANKGNVPIRKCWPEMLLAWRIFADKHEDAYLYIHSEEVGVANGFNIPRYLDSIGAPRDRVRVVPQYQYKLGLPNTVLANLYSASDVLLSTSRGEGFGVPVLEAQACGIPVIVTNWTAQIELAGVGWRVEGQPEWDEHQLGYWKVPSIELIVQSLEEAYAARKDKEQWAEIQESSVRFAADYETKTVYDKYWRPIISHMQGLSKDQPLMPNREQRRAAAKKQK